MHDLAAMPSRLAAFLATERPDLSEIEVTSYEVMTGGYSRLLARATVVAVGLGGGRTTTQYVLRGDPPSGKSLIHTDRAYEYDVLRAVDGRVQVPRALHADLDGDRLGTRAIVLESSTAESLLPHLAARETYGELPLRLAEAAASIHVIPLADLPPCMARPASWDEYIDARIDEWRQTAVAHVESLPILRYVASWLRAHKPAPVPLGLVHGDFQSANLLVRPDGSLEVLDWELAQVGDPREDLGYFKAVATALPPDLIAIGGEAFCARYRELTGLTDEQLNPAVLEYFSVLGVVGTVRRLLVGIGEWADGENTLLASLFSLNSIMFGHMLWLDSTEALEAAL